MNIDDELRRLADQIQPDDQFQSNLEKRLAQAAQAQPQPGGRRRSIVPRDLVWIALGAVLVLGLAWGIRNLLPDNETITAGQPTLSQTAPVEAAGPSTAAAPATPFPTPTEPALAEATPTGAVQISQSAYFSGEGVALQVELPQAPAEASVYQQSSYPELTIESAKAMAAQLGVYGAVYNSGVTDAIGEKRYTATDGEQTVEFLNSPERFNYTSRTRWFAGSPDLPPLENQIISAETFLQEHNLLDSPYQVETDPTQPGFVYFIPSLDGLPVRVDQAPPALITVRVGEQGKVLAITYQSLPAESVGVFPIIDAHAAWKMLTAEQTTVGILVSEPAMAPASEQKIWIRSHPDNQEITLFGYLAVLQPLETGNPAFVSLNGYPLSGAIDQLLQDYSNGTLYEITGTMQRESSGQQALQVKGWQVSPLPYQIFAGAIHWQDGKGYLMGETQSYRLPDLPGDIPEGLNVQLNGVALEDPEPRIEWDNVIYGQGGGGGGANGSGGGFRELNLQSEPTPVPAPTPTVPYQAGQPVDGLEGGLFITEYQQADGGLRTEFTLNVNPGPAWPDGLYAGLEGALGGIEILNRLPIRIWGAFSADSGSQGQPLIEVERYEPVIPGARYQGWLGTIDVLALEGQSITRLTAEDGKQYILSESIDQDPDPQMSNPGDLVIVEGYLDPLRTFAGLPVLSNTIVNLASFFPEPAAYLAQVEKPVVVLADNAPDSHGAAVIEHVELVYTTSDPWFTAANPNSPPPYVQPAWRFSGHYSDGTPVEALVQALQSQYLK